jgi:subtilase family serine protease
VVDYSDPSEPRQVGHFIAEGATSWGALYHRGYVYVGDMSRGLDVFRFTGVRPNLPDLTLSRSGISFSDRSPENGDLVTITARVRNAGDATAAPVTVRFSDDGTPIAEAATPAIPAGESRTVSVSWVAGAPGRHAIGVTADEADVVDEQVESNNGASRSVEVG